MSNPRTFTIARRALMGAAAAMPLVAAGTASAAHHKGDKMKKGPGYAQTRTFKLGEFEVSTILAGTRPVENPHDIFGLNVDDETFNSVSEANFIPADVAQFFFNMTLVNTGNEVILFDTGLNGQATTEALHRAGYKPEDITHIVITHMHGDHIGGMMTDGKPTFPNAVYITGQTEWDHWSQAENDNFENNIRPLADKFTMIGDGDEVTTGITGMNAFGHTPGHMVFKVTSGDASILVAADFANHYVWSVANPSWEVSFDMDSAMAEETRRRILDMLAETKMPFIGYHMPFPGIGYIEKTDGNYRYVAQSYQLMLG